LRFPLFRVSYLSGFGQFQKRVNEGIGAMTSGVVPGALGRARRASRKPRQEFHLAISVVSGVPIYQVLANFKSASTKASGL
jgi:hypothetical protein